MRFGKLMWRCLAPYRGGMPDPDAFGILAALDAFGRCLTARDLPGTLALLAHDADVTIVPSEGVDAHRGRQAISSFLATIYGGPRTYEWRWQERWTWVRDDVASFVALGDELIHGDTPQPRVIPYCLTGTLVRRDRAWRFLLLHGSEASSPG